MSEWLLGLKWELILLFLEWVSDYWDSSGNLYYYSLREQMIIGTQVGTYTTILWVSEWLLGLKWVPILLVFELVSDYWGSSGYLYSYSLSEWVIIGAEVDTYTAILWMSDYWGSSGYLYYYSLSEWLLGLKWILILLFSEWVIIGAQVDTYTTILWASDYWGSSGYLYYYSLSEWVIIGAQVGTYTTSLLMREWLLGLKWVLILLFPEWMSEWLLRF